MSNNCVLEAFRGIGIDITKGLDEGEAKRLTAEINALMEGMNSKELSDQEKMLLDNTIRGSLMDKADAAVKERQLYLELMRDNPSPKKLANRFGDLFTGENASILKMSEVERMELAKAMYRDLDKSARKLLEATQNITNGKNVNEYLARGVFELNHGGKLSNTDIPASMHKDIESIYNGIIKMQERNWFRQKNVGIRMGKLDNYMWKQKWSAEALAKLGKESWVDRLEKGLDMDKVFAKDNLKANTPEAKQLRAAIFGEMFDKITNKVQGIDIEDADPIASILKGKSNSRRLFFKDGESAFNMFKDFTDDTNIKSILDSEMLNSAQLTAIRGTLGSTPKSVVNNLLSRTAKNLPAGRVRKSYTDKVQSISRLMLERPTYDQNLLSSMASAVGAVQMLKLGATAIRQVPMDIAAVTRTLMVAEGNMNALESMARSMKVWSQNVFTTLTDSDVNEAMGLFFDQGIGSAMQRIDSVYAPKFSADQHGASIVQGGVNKFLKSTGLNFMTDMNRSVIANQIGMTIGDALQTAAKGFDGEPARVQKAFTNLLVNEGRLTSAEINLLGKNMDKMLGTADVSYMKKQFNPDKIQQLPDELVRPEIKNLKKQLSGLDPESDAARDLKIALGREIGIAKRQKAAIHRKVKGLMLGKIDSGVPVPNPRYSMKRLVKGQHVSGYHQAFSVMFMFKDTILNMTAKTMEQAQVHYTNVGASGAAVSAATLFAGTTAFYLATDLITSALMNREPTVNKILKEDYVEAAADVTNRISLAPMFSDPIVRMMTRQSPFQKDALTETLMGPAGGMGSDFLKAASHKKAPKELTKFAMRHLNPLNHWATDAILRHSGTDMKRLGKVKKKSEFRLDGR